MVELLLTAFILAVGILGLSMLQVMSIKASRGGRSLSTAVLVADKVMDQVELEGRLTWLDITSSQYTTATSGLPTKYINAGAAVTDTFTVKGNPPDLTKPVGDPDRDVYFTVQTLRGAAAGAAGTGLMHDYSVTVTFNDEVSAAAGTPIQRTVVLTRRILHG